MKIVVIGLGQIGQELAKESIEKNHDVTVIDTNKNLIDNFTNKYDAIGIVGSGASREIQEKAKCEIADVVISVAETDEINLMSSLTAKYLGAKYTIAKVKSLEYQNDDEFLREKFKIDLVINSELSTADEITKIVSYPSNIRVERFLESKINMAEMTLKQDNPNIGLTLKEFIEKYKNRINIGCIVRNNKVIIPSTKTKLQKDDTIYVLARTLQLYKFLKKNDLIKKTVKSALIVGSGNIVDKLISNLIKMGIKTKVIEFDLKNCQELSEKYENVEIIYGEELNSDLLIEEGIKDYDCCISLTKNDESNLVISMFAWSCNTKKIITKISSISYTSMLHNVEIDSTVSPYSIFLSSVIKYIRNIKDCINKPIHELYRFANNQVDAIEFFVDKNYEYCNKEFYNLKIKNDILIAFIIRDAAVLVPTESSVLLKGDKIIVISKANKEIAQISDIFEMN